MVFVNDIMCVDETHKSASDLPNDDKATVAKLGNIFPADEVIIIIDLMYKYFKHGPEKRKYYGLPDNYFGGSKYKPKVLVDVLKVMEDINLVYIRYHHGNRYWKLTRRGKKLAELLESL